MYRQKPEKRRGVFAIDIVLTMFVTMWLVLGSLFVFFNRTTPVEAIVNDAAQRLR